MAGGFPIADGDGSSYAAYVINSSTAAAALRQAGFAEAVKLRDGLTAWEQANLPIQKGARA